jgi:hypothetical protein
MNDVAHAFAPGHRVRLALSPAYWPLVWPSPEPVTLTVSTEGSRLVLPVRPPDPADALLRPFEPPECAPRAQWTPLTKGGFERRSQPDASTGELVSHMRSGFEAPGRVALERCEPADMEGGDGVAIETRIHPRDPLRACAAMSQRSELRRGSWRVAIETDVRVSCTRTELRVEARLAASEGESCVAERGWDERVPRIGI